MQMLAHFLFGHRGRQQLFTLRRVHTVETGPRGGGRSNAEVDLFRAGIKDHLFDLAAGGATHNRIVDQNDPLALDQRAVHVEL